MKLKYRLTVTSEDVRRCFQRSDNADISILTRDFRQTKDEEMYDAVITTFNRHDSAKHVGDSLRKWVNAKVNEIISHLNTAHGRIVYTEKLLGSLLSKYYEKTTAKETVE
jgi:two-component SAPR family response regulator